MSIHTVILRWGLLGSLFFLGLSSTFLYSQQSVHTSGGEATGPDGELSFSIGQIDYIQIQKKAGSAFFGVQQPYKPEVIQEETLTCLLSPNPSTGMVKLSTDNLGSTSFDFKLYDLWGRKLRGGSEVDVHETLDFSGLSGGVYIIDIRNEKNQRWKCKLIIVKE